MDIDEIVWFFSPSITLIIFPSSHILPSGCHIYEKAEKMLTFSGEFFYALVLIHPEVPYCASFLP